MIWTRASWLGYFIGLLTAGIIELNAGSVGGPVLWLLALAITPFGLPSLRNR